MQLTGQTTVQEDGFGVGREKGFGILVAEEP